MQEETLKLISVDLFIYFQSSKFELKL